MATNANNANSVEEITNTLTTKNSPHGSQESLYSQDSQGSQGSQEDVITVNTENQQTGSNRYGNKRGGIGVTRHDIPKRKSPKTVRKITPPNNHMQMEKMKAANDMMGYVGYDEMLAASQEQFVSRSQLHLTQCLQHQQQQQQFQHMQFQQQHLQGKFQFGPGIPSFGSNAMFSPGMQLMQGQNLGVVDNYGSKEKSHKDEGVKCVQKEIIGANCNSGIVLPQRVEKNADMRSVESMNTPWIIEGNWYVNHGNKPRSPLPALL